MKYELYQSCMEEVDNHIRILEDFPPNATTTCGSYYLLWYDEKSGKILNGKIIPGRVYNNTQSYFI